MVVKELTETEQRQLEQVISDRKSSQSEVKRAKVVLTSGQYPGWTDAQVSEAIGCSPALVRKWRKRWCQTRSLKEAARSGRPRSFLPVVRSQVTAIACTRPCDAGIPLDLSGNKRQ